MNYNLPKKIFNQMAICIIALFLVSISQQSFAQNPSIDAEDDHVITFTNTAVTVNILGNDTGSDLEVAISGTPNNGTAALNSDNSVTYTPNLAFEGEDSLRYFITDTINNISDIAWIYVEVQNVGELAQDDAASTNINTPVVIHILDNDEAGVTLINNSLTTPANGSVTLNADSSVTYTPNVNFYGNDSFQYSVTNANGALGAATVLVNVQNVDTNNNPPNEELMYFCTPLFTPVQFCLPGTDVDGDPLVIIEDQTTTLFNCSLVFLNDSCIRYTPLPGFSGTDTVFVQMCDNQSPPACAESQVVITVGDECPSPIALNDTAFIEPSGYTFNGEFTATQSAYIGTPLNATQNDIDLCGGPLTVTSILEDGNNGTAILAGGQIVYTPDAGFSGNDVVTYQTCNTCFSGSECASAQIYITVAEQTSCDTNQTICIAPFNSEEVCPEFCNIDELDITNITASASAGFATPSATSTNCFDILPPNDSVSSLTVTFTATDAEGNTDQTVFTVNVDANCGTNAPIANDDNFVIQPGGNSFIDVTANDVEPDGQDLTISILEQPTCGVASVNNGQILIESPQSCTGLDELVYQICDTSNPPLCDSATVYLNYEQDCPDPSVVCTEALEYSTICVDFCEIAGTPGASISDANTTFNCSINLLNDTCIEYIPLPGFFGPDVIVIVGTNDAGQTDTISVPVFVGCSTPTAMDDTFSVPTNQTSNLNPLDNDFDPCNTLTSATVSSGPNNGTAAFNADLTLDYTPNSNFVGSDILTYIVCNDCDESPQCDTASITITISGEQSLLDPQPDGVTTAANTPVEICVLDNDLGNGLSLNGLTNPENGTLTTVGSCVIYTPSVDFVGEDFFTYEVCDQTGNCETEIVGATVLDADLPNLAPIAQNDVAETPINTAVNIPVALNDSDPENGSLTLNPILANSPANGTAVVNADNTITYTPNTDYTGLDSFVYEICDDATPINCATAIVSVDVGNTGNSNNPPLAMDDTDTTTMNFPILVNVLANDNDPDLGDIINISAVITQPVNGIAQVDNPSGIYYTPNNGFVGTDYIIYQICDTGNPILCDLAVLTIIVEPADELVDAQPDVFNTPQNTQIAFNPLNNDFGVGITLSDIIDQPDNGVLSDPNADGQLTYTPNTDFIGTDCFQYQIIDVNGDTDMAVVCIEVFDPNVGEENLPPVALNDDADTNLNVPVVIDVLENDSDPNLGDELSVQPDNNNPPSNGTAEVQADGSIIYTPNPEAIEHYCDVFGYIVCDDATPALCDTALVQVEIGLDGICDNNPPIADDENITTPEDVSIEVCVLVGDTDPDNDSFNIVAVGEPVHGTTIVDVDSQCITYNPDADYNGTDYFYYVICDDAQVSLCDTATVNIIVTPVSEQELAINPDITYTEEGQLAEFNILDNDFGDNIMVSAVINFPTNGDILSLDPETGEVAYLPNNGFVGTDCFQYEIVDADGNTASTTACIVVLDEEAENEAPIAIDDQVDTPNNTPVTIPVLSNDVDPNNDPLVITEIFDEPSNGTATINLDGTITYSPNIDTTNFCDSFTYIVCDDASPALCDTATVIVNVGEEFYCDDLPPLAINDSTTTEAATPVFIDVLSNDQDPNEAELINITGYIQPVNGSVELVSSNGFSYTPEPSFIGIDQFVYYICDQPNPAALCDTAVVFITVEPQPINANPDIYYTTQNTPTSFNPLSNDEGTNISLTTLVSNPQHGTASVDPLTGLVTYTPNEDFVGTDNFLYEITDGQGNTDITLVTVIITEQGINQPPIAVPDQDSTAVDTPIEICVMNNDFDQDGGPVLLSSISEPAMSGTVVISDDNNCIIYTPLPGFVGIDSFQYVIEDTDTPVGSSIGLVVVHIGTGGPLNAPPLAEDDFITTPNNTPVDICVLSNDSDIDGDQLNISFITNGANGTTELNADACVAYTPDPQFNGEDHFEYVICDNGVPALCDTAVVTILVGDDMTLVINEETQEDTPITICVDEYLSITTDSLEIVSSPENATLITESQVDCITFIPSPNSCGLDSYELLSFSDGQSVPITVFVEVICQPDNPIAVNDTAEVCNNISGLIDVLANDSDNDGGEINAIIITELPNNPNAMVMVDIEALLVEYTAQEDTTYSDSFCYIIINDQGLQSDTACVFVNVAPCDTIPTPSNELIAVNDTTNTPQDTPVVIDILSNDTIPDTTAIDTSIMVIVPPNMGSIILQDNNSINYIPAPAFTGTDQFTYELCLNLEDGSTICDTAVVVITILPQTPPTNLVIANTFSPNDDGINDRFIIQGIEQYEENEPMFMIFNRWGDVVYSVQPYTNELAWDGYWQKNRTQVPDGTYFYVLKLNTGEDADDRSGFIELIR